MRLPPPSKDHKTVVGLWIWTVSRHVQYCWGRVARQSSVTWNNPSHVNSNEHSWLTLSPCDTCPQQIHSILVLLYLDIHYNSMNNGKKENAPYW